MGTKEQNTTTETEALAGRNANTTTPTRPKQQQQQQQQKTHTQRASSPNTTTQVLIIPATQASTLATNAAKKIRRAFSMPRNPFRWSRKFKTSTHSTETGGGENASIVGKNSAITSCVGGGRGRSGSIISLNSYENVCKDTNGNVQQPTLESSQSNGDIENSKTSIEKKQSSSTTNLNAAAAANNGVGKSSNNNNNCNANGTTGGNGNGASSNRVLRRSSFRKFLNRISQQLSTSINVGTNKNATNMTPAHILSSSSAATSERVPPIGCYQWPADQTPGVMGLKNHGNTCFMNAVLQCLSHTDILAEYFVLDQYKVDLKRRNKINSRKFGTKGELTEQLANVLKALWTCRNESDHSTSFKAVVDRYGTQFRSSTQHDAQEFLFWLLDKVHEDLNTATKRRYKSVKNNYGRPDEIIAAETLANHIRCNNSFVQAVFQAQFRSSLTCPRCEKQSNTFDPFHCISVQLPQLAQQTVFVTVVYMKQQPRQMRMGLTVSAGSPIIALREQLQSETGIAGEQMVLVDLNKEGFTRVFFDTQPVATLNGNETIYCIEVPEAKLVDTANPTTIAEAIKTPPKISASTSVASTASTPTVAVKEQSQMAKPTTAAHATDLLLLVANVRKSKTTTDNAAENAENANETKSKNNSADYVCERFGAPFSMKVPRDCSYLELQKKLLREMSPLLKPEVFSYTTPLNDMFQIRLQDPSADPDTYLERVEHPLLTEMIDLALSVLSAEAGPSHIKVLLEWSEPAAYFADLTDTIVEHESVARLSATKPSETAALTLEQCLEHYTKAETLSAEDAWRCPHCQQYLPVVKTLGLWSLPDILVVHFKRFRQHQAKGSNAAKLTTMVKFPLMAFDMSPHLARGINGETNSLGSNTLDSTAGYRPSPWKKTRAADSRSSTLNSRFEPKDTRYDLYAVCYHQGDTLETGHYTAACKNPYDRQWYKFDDQRVNKVSNDDINEEIINNEAYMLFYQRRSVEPAECSGSSSNSGDHWVSRIAPPTQPTAAAVTEKNTKEAVNIQQTNDNAEDDVQLLKEKAEMKAVEIPKVNIALNEDLIAPADAPLETNETPSERVLLNIEELDFADADKTDDFDVENNVVVAAVNAELNSALLLVETRAEINDICATSAHAENDIFDMDEECHSIQKNMLPLSTALSNETATVESHQLVKIVEKTSPLLHTATLALDAVVATAISNGKISPHNSKSHSISNTSTATSSTSSLSSRSSPHSLAVSINGASTLQSKFNGYSTTCSTAANNNIANANTSCSSYKELQLSSSLKSNSGGVGVGAVGGGGGGTTIASALSTHSHEFHLSRHHLQQHNWHGSRSSVSAIENATQQAQQHAQSLNLRHSFSTSSNYKLRECSETISSLLRNSANTCSKDTLLFIDQQNHHNMIDEDEDDSFMGRSLWISPVTPHKLITVSPKN